METLDGRLMAYAERLRALHEAGKSADPRYKGEQIQANFALIDEARLSLSRMREALDAVDADVMRDLQCRGIAPAVVSAKTIKLARSALSRERGET